MHRGKIGKKPFGVWSARLSAQSNQKKSLRQILPNGKSAEATGHTDTVPSFWQCPERRKMLPPTWHVQSGSIDQTKPSEKCLDISAAVQYSNAHSTTLRVA